MNRNPDQLLLTNNVGNEEGDYENDRAENNRVGNNGGRVVGKSTKSPVNFVSLLMVLL